MRHIQSNAQQKSLRDSEKFMTEMPTHLRHMVIEKTHGPIIEKISFFKQKNDINKDFTT